MNIVLGIIVGLLVLTLLVVLHEGGHFLMAVKNGVKVNEFGIGFPPRAIAWVKGKDGKWHRFYKKDWQKPQDGLIFSINWLPIGGFCSMDGESDADTRKGTFGAATFWQKTKILFGGVLMNWLTAIVIFTILALTGMPRLIDNQFHLDSDTRVELHPVSVVEILENSPASAAGFQKDDLIVRAVAIKNEPASYPNSDTTSLRDYKFYSQSNPDSDKSDITDSLTLTNFNDAHAGEQVIYYAYTKTENCSTGTVECVGEKHDFETSTDYVPNGYSAVIYTAKLNPKDSEYRLGVTMHSTGQTLYHSTWSAPLVGVVTTVQLTGETFRGLGMMVYNFFHGIASQFNSDDAIRSEGQAELQSAGDSVTGPVGILGVLFPAFIESGLTNLAMLAAIISISLACMNVLPIPALDGGRWLLIALFRLRKKPLDTETESKIVSRAFLVLIALALLITVLDVVRIFR